MSDFNVGFQIARELQAINDRLSRVEQICEMLVHNEQSKEEVIKPEAANASRK